jgi:hypothetical protein
MVKTVLLVALLLLALTSTQDNNHEKGHEAEPDQP